MRQVYVVTYDISDPKRLRQVFKVMRAWGEHIQYSVFRCEIDPRELVELRSELDEVIHHDLDQVLFIDLGPVEGRGDDAISSMGRVYLQPHRLALVV